MTSRNLMARARREGMRHAERGRGVPPSLMRFSAGRMAEVNLPNVRLLPVVASDKTLQNEAGEFLYLEGYSEPGGPDIGS